MKTILGLLVVLAGSSAFANTYTTDMTCGEVQDLIYENGAAVLYQSADIYDRYVSTQAYCSLGEYMKPDWIRTSDTHQCLVYRCQSEDHGG